MAKEEAPRAEAVEQIDPKAGYVHAEGGKLVQKHAGWFEDGLTEEEHAAKIAQESARG